MESVSIKTLNGQVISVNEKGWIEIDGVTFAHVFPNDTTVWPSLHGRVEFLAKTKTGRSKHIHLNASGVQVPARA